jgi:hypothetical protein
VRGRNNTSSAAGNGKAARLTVAVLANAKRLPADFLLGLGLIDLPEGGVGIPYYDTTGVEVAVKQRTALKATEGSYWPKGRPLAAYGSWRTDRPNKTGFLILVEGESDCWALWHHGLPALGIPGANAVRTLEKEHVEGVPTVYVHREPDNGGTAFVEGVRRRLPELGFDGKAFELRMPEGTKDPADLHTEAPEQFLERLQAAIGKATPLEIENRARERNGRSDGTGHESPAPADGSESWERPIPFAEVPPAPFPLEVLPRPLAEMADAVARSMPCPVDMPACAMLCAAATAIGNTRQLKIKTSWYEGPRLWIANVSRPGTKKSPSSSAAMRPVRQAQKRLRKEYAEALQVYEQELQGWEEAAAAAKKNGETPPEKPKPPVERQVFTTDTTREALADLLNENPRGLLLHRDELTGWARSLNQYKGGRGDDRQFWLSLWSGEAVVVNRRGRKVYVDDPFICVSGNLPPEVFGELNDECGREDGFIHRLLFSWPATVRPGWTDVEPAPETLDAYGAFFESLFRLEADRDEDGDPRPRTLRFTPDGKRIFVTFVNRLAADLADEAFPDQLRGPWSKLEGGCARLALVLHLCRWVAKETDSEDIDEASAAGAVRLAEYFQGHARRVYACLTDAGGERLRKDAAAVLEWVQRNRAKIEPAAEGKPPLAFTWRMVRHDLHNRFGDREEDLRQALRSLEGRGYLREAPRERQGAVGRQPKPDYIVHPETWCRNDQNDRNGTPERHFDHSDHFGTMSEEKDAPAEAEDVEVI